MSIQYLSIIFLFGLTLVLGGGVAQPLNTSIKVPHGHYFLWLYASWEGILDNSGSITFLPFIYFKNESVDKVASVTIPLVAIEKGESLEVLYSLGEISDGNWTRIRKTPFGAGTFSLSQDIPNVSGISDKTANHIQLLNIAVSTEDKSAIHLLIVAENLKDLMNFYTIPDGSIFTWEPDIILK